MTDPSTAVAREVVIHADAEVLAEAAAARVLIALADAQARRGTASVVLTGGGIGTATLKAIAASPLRDTVRWRAVDIWWGDERFVERDDPDRNEKQAREALLDQLDLDPDRVFPMGWSGGPDGTGPAAADTAASRYAEALSGRAPAGRAAPRFDVLLLGLGPEGHVASIFPHSPAASDERAAVGVHNCPKPPPTRVSMTFSALTCAAEVWVIVSGAEKAGAVAQVMDGASPLDVPAAGAVGEERTLWLIDEAAASSLPPR